MSSRRRESAMAEDPCLPFMEEVPETGDELKEVFAEVEDLKPSKYRCQIRDKCISLFHNMKWLGSYPDLLSLLQENLSAVLLTGRSDFFAHGRSVFFVPGISDFLVTSVVRDESLHIWGRRVADAIVVSAVVLLYFVYRYLIGFIDRGGSKAGSSGSLDFRDIYISIVLFLAAYVWIKFRDVIPRGAVYHRRDSNKWEPRIKFPVTRGVGGKSKRIPLGLYDTFAEGEVAYQIAAFYCKKRKHTGRLDLKGGAYFPIPALNVDPGLPYEEKVKQVGDQVLKVYAEFEEQKASRNLPPNVPGLALEMLNGEGQLIASSPIQQLRQPLNSGMDLAIQGQGSQPAPNIHNGIDFCNPGSVLLLHAETQHELLDAHKQIECLKAQVAQTNYENMRWEVKYSEVERKYSENIGWEVKYSELERKYSKLEQKISEVEHENGLLNLSIMQSQLQTQYQEQEFDTNIFLSMGHEESLAR